MVIAFRGTLKSEGVEDFFLECEINHRWGFSRGGVNRKGMNRAHLSFACSQGYSGMMTWRTPSAPFAPFKIAVLVACARLSEGTCHR